MKKIKILAGVAGVGKSTYINQHKKENDLVLSSDQLRIELYGNLEEGNKYNGEVFNELNNRLRQAIKTHDGDIYYDTTAVSRKQRAGLYKQIKKTAELNDYEIEVVLLHKPLEQIKEQNNERTGFARVPDDVVERMYKALQAPRIGVDCDSFRVVAPDFSEYMDEINHRVDEPHNSPYHAESLQEHMDMVNRSAEKTNDERLIELAYHHDLGKAVSRTRNNKRSLATDYIRHLYGEHDRYMGHENVGSIYYLVKHKDNLTPEVSDMSMMIEYHMLAHEQIPAQLIHRDKLSPEMLETLAEFAEIDSKARILDQTIFDTYQKYLNSKNDLTKAYQQKDSILISTNFDRDLHTLKYLHGGVDFTDIVNRNARGLTYDSDGNIVTIGFEKFFNYRQLDEYQTYTDEFKEKYANTNRNLNLEVYEKLDGTFITLGLDKNDNLVAATSSSTSSKYTQLAEDYFNNLPNIDKIKTFMKNTNMSLMFEYTSPDNMIVIPYNQTEFTLIGARQRDINAPISEYKELQVIAGLFDLKVCQSQKMDLDQIIEYQKTNKTSEGFVARNEYGNLLKFKTDYWFEEKENLGDLFFGNPLTQQKVNKYVELYMNDEMDDFLAYKNQRVGKGGLHEIDQLYNQLQTRISEYKTLTDKYKDLSRRDIAQLDIDDIGKSIIFKNKEKDDFTVDEKQVKKIANEIVNDLKNSPKLDVSESIKDLDQLAVQILDNILENSIQM